MLVRLCQGQFILLLLIFTWLGLSRGGVVGDIAYNDLLLHFLGYVAASLSIGLACPRWHLWQRGLLLLSYSTLIEIIQHFLPPRTFDLYDIAANGSGILVGLLLFALLQKPLRHCRLPV